jgi:hypothetical protein
LTAIKNENHSHPTIQLWGDPAAAARLHIIADLKQEGWTEADSFPRDEPHYQRVGLF